MMMYTKDITEFVRLNDKQLNGLIVWKTKIFDQEIIKEIKQQFYLYLIKKRALETFDPGKGSFGVYMLQLLSWSTADFKLHNVLKTVEIDYRIYDEDKAIELENRLQEFVRWIRRHVPAIHRQIVLDGLYRVVSGKRISGEFEYEVFRKYKNIYNRL